MRASLEITCLVAFAVVASGCNLALSTPEPTRAMASGGQVQPSGVPASPFIGPSSTSPAVQTSSPSVHPPSVACPIPAGSPAPPSLKTPGFYVQDVLAFLDGGGNPHDLQARIQSAGLSPQVGMPLAQQDFNGDGQNDVAVTILAPDDTAMMMPGDLYVFVCAGQAYALAYTSVTVPQYGAPEIIDARDLNADGAADLLLARETCGAHTCFSRLEVLTWRQNTLINVLQGQSDDLPYPSIRITGPDARGRFDVAVTGTGIGSAGAGPYRGVTRTWAWDAAGDALVPGPDLELPSTFRIHVLNDADRADQDGDYATALELYDQVIRDDSLMDWIDPDTERANLSAYAMFREVVTHLQLADMNAAQVAYLALRDAYPPASLGGAYGLLGQAFWTAYQSNDNISLACAQARAFAQANEATILQPLYFGYANPTYTAADICPVAGP